MAKLKLGYPMEEAKIVVKEALQRTEGISKVEEGGHQIVGKTGISFPRVLWSYGENVYIEFSDPDEDGKIPIEVRAEKSIWTNIFAQPEKFKREFLSELDEIRDRPIEEIQG